MAESPFTFLFPRAKWSEDTKPSLARTFIHVLCYFGCWVRKQRVYLSNTHCFLTLHVFLAVCYHAYTHTRTECGGFPSTRSHSECVYVTTWVYIFRMHCIFHIFRVFRLWPIEKCFDWITLAFYIFRRRNARSRSWFRFRFRFYLRKAPKFSLTNMDDESVMRFINWADLNNLERSRVYGFFMTHLTFYVSFKPFVQRNKAVFLFATTMFT